MRKVEAFKVSLMLEGYMTDKIPSDERGKEHRKLFQMVQDPKASVRLVGYRTSEELQDIRAYVWG